MKSAVFVLLMLAVASASFFAVEHTEGLYLNEKTPYLLQVKDRATGYPVEGATVELYSESLKISETTTNNQGYAYFPITPDHEGFYAFIINANGYRQYVIIEKVLVPEVEQAINNTQAASILLFEPIVTSNETENLTSPATGYLTVSSSDVGFFFLVVGIILICLGSASYMLYQNYFFNDSSLDKEESNRITKAFDSIVKWFQEQLNN